MHRLLKLLWPLLLLSTACFGQTLSITATITDSDSQTWNNGSWSAQIYSPNGIPFYNGAAIPTATFYGTMNSSGILSDARFWNTSTINPSGALYIITMCAYTSAPCSQFNVPVTSSGQFQAAVNALIKAPRFPAGATSYGYADGEISVIPYVGGSYFNVTSLMLREWNGTAWQNVGGTGSGTVNPSGTAGLIPYYTAIGSTVGPSACSYATANPTITCQGFVANNPNIPAAGAFVAQLNGVSEGGIFANVASSPVGAWPNNAFIIEGEAGGLLLGTGGGGIPIVFAPSRTQIGSMTTTGLNSMAIGATVASTGRFTNISSISLLSAPYTATDGSGQLIAGTTLPIANVTTNPSTTFWINSASTFAGTPDGTESKPFLTVQAAFAAMTQAAPYTVFMAQGGTYTFAAFTWPSAPTHVTIYGNGSTWAISSGTLTPTAPIDSYDLTQSGNITYNTGSVSSQIFDGFVTGNVTVGGNVVFDHEIFTGGTAITISSGSTFVVNGGNMNGHITSAGGSLIVIKNKVVMNSGGFSSNLTCGSGDQLFVLDGTSMVNGNIAPNLSCADGATSSAPNVIGDQVSFSDGATFGSAVTLVSPTVRFGTAGLTTSTATTALATVSGVIQLAASSTGGTCAMSAGTSCTITIATTYAVPVCIATQQSATLTGGAVGCTVSGTTVTITSAVLNSETWGAFVFGNPN